MINEANILKKINNLCRSHFEGDDYVELQDVFEAIFDEMGKYSTTLTSGSQLIYYNGTPLYNCSVTSVPEYNGEFNN